MSEQTRWPPRMVAWFGGSGLLPFVGLAAMALLAPEAAQRGWALDGLHLYGAVILSFIGGCRWGFSCAGFGPGPTAQALMIAVAPSLYGWAAVWLAAASAAGPILAVGFALMLIEDMRATRAGETPAWWPRLRAPLSVGAMIALATPSLI